MSDTTNRTIQDVIAKRKQKSRRVDQKLIMKAYNLAEEKTNKEQIEMCFKAYNDENWQTQFD